jgi:butyrate kinase
VAAWDEALCEIAIFPLSACSDGIIEQQLLPWLKTFINTSQDLQFIVTSGGTPEFTSSLATHLGISAYTIDPATSSECPPLTLVTGTPALTRRCAADTFIFKYLVRQEASDKGLELDEARFIVAHLDEENHLGALFGTSVLEALTSFDEGPFALRQSGALPFDSVLDLCMSSDGKDEVLKILHEEGGLAGYLGLQNLEDLWACQGEKADAIREALVYQISKEIGALATVLKGKVHSIILAGELTRHEPFIEALAKRIGFVAPISVYPGNQGLSALLAGAQRILEQSPTQ